MELSKFAHRMWKGFCAFVQMAQAYRVFSWLRDHHDIF